MSFSSDVRDELLEKTGRARHCLIAELAAMCLFSGKFIKNSAEWQFFLDIDRPGIRSKYFTLLGRTLNIRGSDELLSPADTASLCETARLSRSDSGEAVLVDTVVLMQPCCRKSFLRGAFLVSGSVSDPDRSYHFEIGAKREDTAVLTADLIRDFDLDAKITKRKNRYIVYLKEGADVGNLLALMGASRGFLVFENDRVVREVRGNVNRKVNCETANIEKTVGAAVRQLADITLIEEKAGLGSLPENLQEIAILRRDHPELSLTELGKLTHPPIGKSGVNHRLRRIGEIAERLKA